MYSTKIMESATKAASRDPAQVRGKENAQNDNPAATQTGTGEQRNPEGSFPKKGEGTGRFQSV